MRTPPEHLEAPHMLEDVGRERERERGTSGLPCFLVAVGGSEVQPWEDLQSA